MHKQCCRAAMLSCVATQLSFRVLLARLLKAPAATESWPVCSSPLKICKCKTCILALMDGLTAQNVESAEDAAKAAEAALAGLSLQPPK